MRVLRSAFLGGIIVGGISFVAGFFGPIIFTPESNQGPFLGIFITGPLGFIIGALAGSLIALFATRKPPIIQKKPGGSRDAT
jgi:hypothetical protein